MMTDKVTRFEIIDHSACRYCEGTGLSEGRAQCEMCYGQGCNGRQVVVSDKDKQIDVELQDDDRTLKVFIHDRYGDVEN